MKLLLALLIAAGLLVSGCAGTESNQNTPQKFSDKKILFKSVGISDKQDIVEGEIFADNGRSFTAKLKSGETKTLSGNFITIRMKGAGTMEVVIDDAGTKVSEVVLDPAARTGYAPTNDSYRELYNLENLYIGSYSGGKNRYSSVSVGLDGVGIAEATRIGDFLTVDSFKQVYILVSIYRNSDGEFMFIENANSNPRVSYMGVGKNAYENVVLPFTNERGSMISSVSVG